MHTFRDTGEIDLAEQSSSAKNAERMLKREPRKNLLKRKKGLYLGKKGLYLGKYAFFGCAP